MKALEIIASLPNVNYLDLSECRVISPEGIRNLNKLTGLKYLGFWETKLNDDAFNALADLTNLEELDLKATSVTDASVPTILKFQNLKRLNLTGTQLSDTGFIQLKELPNLVWLNVANTNIGFDIIDELAAREGLEVKEYEN